MCAATKIVLEANGFVVTAAADGPSGIRAIEKEPFDLTDLRSVFAEDERIGSDQDYPPDQTGHAGDRGVGLHVRR